MKKKLQYPLACCLGLVIAVGISNAAHAQNAPVTENQPDASGVELGNSAIPDTLMFTIDERNEIITRQSAGNVSGMEYRSGAIEDANLYLSSIVYFGPDEWMLWVNGVQVTPELQVDTFEVVSIQPDYVELVVPLSAAGVRPVRLEPNQTFIGETGAVVEGAYN